MIKTRVASVPEFTFRKVNILIIAPGKSRYQTAAVD